jgi:3-phosphoshikimate 1-carboxyvinyltransferase
MTVPLPDPLAIRPFTHAVHGGVNLPGSKSLTNRALLLAALSSQTVTLTGALFSEDTLIMAEALRRLGFVVEADAVAGTLRVEGQGGAIPVEAADLFVGLAGTAARFLVALCAAAPRGVYRLDGVPQIRKRPMKGLLDALRQMGAQIRCTDEPDHFPIEIHACGLQGGRVAIDASESSQMLSALLMMAPLARTGTLIELSARVREPFVEMTLQMMHQFGIDALSRDGSGLIPVSPGTYALDHAPDPSTGSRLYPIEADATAASYFMALPLVVGGSLGLRGIGNDSLQGDVRFAEVLARAGMTLDVNSGHLVVGWNGGTRHGIAYDFREISDTFLTLAALAPLLQGPTLITGVAHTRRQETDRIHGMARELERLGQRVIETEDGLEIHPQPLRPDQIIETYGDHRFAMAFAILGCHDLRGDGRPWLSVRDPGCCAKTFPGFFAVLDEQRNAAP